MMSTTTWICYRSQFSSSFSGGSSGACLWLALVGDRLGQSMLQHNIALKTQVCLDRGDMCLLSMCCAAYPVPTQESRSVSSYLVVAPSPNMILRIAAVLTLDIPVPFDAFYES
jgi:hypothetical protein